jgi:transposase
MADVDDAMDRVRAVLAQPLAAEQEAIALLDTRPGVRHRTAELLLADSGTEMTRCPNAKPLASWAGLCPGHAERGGTRLSGTTRNGRRW